MDDKFTALAHAIRNRASHKQIVKLVSFIMHNLDRLSARKCFLWHPLGFLHIKLWIFPNGDTLRLHFWPTRKRFTQDEDYLIHNHPWELVSHILCGQVINKEYKIRFEPSSNLKQIHKVSYVNNNSTIEPTGQIVSYEIVSSRNYSKGKYYVVKQGQYHKSIVPISQYAATIALTSDPRNAEPYVLGNIDNSKPIIYERQQCSLEENKFYIKNLISILNKM